MATGSSWKDILARHRERSLAELMDFLRIPSVSAADAHVEDVKRAAEWVARRMRRAGLENIMVMPTGAHTCVYGDWLHAPGAPTVLIYGHFDVQPADPLDLWSSPPFEPVIADGRIYARGSADMKGNLLLCILAAEAHLEANGRLPLNVKFLFEGQEEIGSRDLGPFVAANRGTLACDLVLTPDGCQWSDDQPEIMLGSKGLCAMQIDVETAAMDLHSGVYGGAVPNALHALVALLGTMRDSGGKILVEGFYDTVQPLSQQDREAIALVPFDEAEYRSQIGADALFGEPGYSTFERAWACPTLEVNGIWGGYQGDGVKTVLPAKAHAKITCRLVANQEPDDILEKLEAHVRLNAPRGARIAFKREQGRARPYHMPADHPGVQAVAEVLESSYGKQPYYVRSGGTLPIMDMFLQELNAYTVDVGFAQDDERMHSPNEFLRLADFERGQVVYGELLERLATVDASTLRRG